MHKLLTIVLFLCTCTSAVALSNGNPSSPQIPEEGFMISKEAWLAFKVGYQGDLVFDRKMGDDIDELEILANAATAAILFDERYEIYASAGAASFDVHQRLNSITRVEYETKNGFAWAVGGRAILWERGNTKLGLDVKYFHADPDIRSLTLNGAGRSTDGAELHYCEWQVGLGAAQQIDFLIPYIALIYSRAHVELKYLDSLAPSVPEHFSAKSRNALGLSLGCGLTPYRSFDLNLEVQLISEQAITLSGEVRF